MRFIITRWISSPVSRWVPFPTANMPLSIWVPPTRITWSSSIQWQIFLSTKSLKSSRASPLWIWTLASNLTPFLGASNTLSRGFSKNLLVPKHSKSTVCMEPPWEAGGNAGKTHLTCKGCIFGTSSPVYVKNREANSFSAPSRDRSRHRSGASTLLMLARTESNAAAWAAVGFRGRAARP